MMRRLATPTLAAILLTGVSLTVTTTSATAAAPTDAQVTAAHPRVGAFSERYHGRRIHGWGGDQPCAFIDGRPLELISHGQNWYSSAVNAYETTFGARATTRAAVRSLAGADLQPAEPSAHCRP